LLSKLSSEQLIDDLFALLKSRKVDLVNCHSILHSVGNNAASKRQGYIKQLKIPRNSYLLIVIVWRGLFMGLWRVLL
jgi:hypothetical protein